jgi:hypothetical protein
MGQEQTLLAVLGAVLVGIATTVGINLFSPDLSTLHYSNGHPVE